MTAAGYADAVSRQPTVAPRPTWPQLVVAALVFAWGVYQAFWNLGARNRGGDEPVYTEAGWQYVHGDFAMNREHPPTAKYLFGIAELVSGHGVIGPRAVVAAMVVLGGAVVLWWLRSEIGWWGGLAAAGLWMLTTRGIPGDDGLRIDRSAIIDPVMVFFAITAFATAWRWIRTRHVGWIALSGALMAMSVTSKVSTVVLLPVFLVLPILFRRWRDLLVGGAVWVGAFVVVAAGLYLPMGARSAIRYMVTFQHQHDVTGHLTQVAGVTYVHPPWWANAWFTVQGMGLPLVVVLVVGVLAALVVRPDRLVVVLVSALALLAAFYLGYAHVALAYYYYAWTWLLVVIAAIGYARLARLRPRALTLPVSLAAMAVAAVGATSLSVHVWQSRPEGIARVPQVLRTSAPKGGDVLVASLSPSDYTTYLGSRGTMDATSAPFSAIVVGSDTRFPLTPAEQAVLHDDRRDFRVRHLDDITVWIPDGLIVARNGALSVTEPAGSH